MDAEQALQIKTAAEARMSAASAVMKSFPRLPNGLTPDHIKATLGWKVAKSESEQAFANLRKINAFYVKNFR